MSAAVNAVIGDLGRNLAYLYVYIQQIRRDLTQVTLREHAFRPPHFWKVDELEEVTYVRMEPRPVHR